MFLSGYCLIWQIDKEFLPNLNTTYVIMFRLNIVNQGVLGTISHDQNGRESFNIAEKLGINSIYGVILDFIDQITQFAVIYA